MFLELIATIVAGLAGAGVMMLIVRASGGRLPRWLTPVAAGAAMIFTTITSEYGWYQRTSEVLPEGFIVVETVESKALYRPWTYIAPYTNRFIAVDEKSLQTHPDKANEKIANVYFFGRWAAVERVSVLVDCDAKTRALLDAGASFDDNGDVSGVNWFQPQADDALLKYFCG